MFCRFCGKQVDPSSRVCPYCGEPQEARTGGNGFWDILGKEPVQAVPQTVVKPIETPTYEDTTRKEPKKKGVSSRVLLLAVILGIVCTAILGVVELSTLGSLKKEMTAALQENEAAIQALEKEAAAAAQENEKAIRALEKKIEALEADVEAMKPVETTVATEPPATAEPAATTGSDLTMTEGDSEAEGVG